MSSEAVLPDPQLFAEIEALAVELAALGGEEIVRTLGAMLTVKYKGCEDSASHLRDPVSEVDQHVERLIRERVARQFPSHGIIGEEMAVQPGTDQDFIWCVDPIDGTTNFINGFPLFASSVGVTFKGVPIVGALWCSTSHLLRPGVYHSRPGSAFQFDGAALTRTPNPAVRRRLAGEPHAQRSAGPWDGRKTGSAAIECAFVAAGLLQVARFETPNVWDVAGGIALVKAAGGVVHDNADGRWREFSAFGEELAGVAAWRRPLIIGREEDVSTLGALSTP